MRRNEKSSGVLPRNLIKLHKWATVYIFPHYISLDFLFIYLYIYVDDTDESDVAEPINGDQGDTFMQSYSDVMNEELKATTLGRSFVRANEQIPKKDEVFCLCLLKCSRHNYYETSQAS